MIRLAISGDLELESGGHRFHLGDADGETRLTAPSFGSLFYLLRSRGGLPQSLPEGLETEVVVCLKQRPVATVRAAAPKPSIRLHPLRFLKG